MQCGLCLTMPCPMSGSTTCDSLMFTNMEALYRHLTKYHTAATQAKIGDTGKKRQKTAVIKDIIMPLLAPWLAQIQTTVQDRQLGSGNLREHHQGQLKVRWHTSCHVDRGSHP